MAWREKVSASVASPPQSDLQIPVDLRSSAGGKPDHRAIDMLIVPKEGVSRLRRAACCIASTHICPPGHLLTRIAAVLCARSLEHEKPTALGWTQQDLDNIFIAAAAINP